MATKRDSFLSHIQERLSSARQTEREIVLSHIRQQLATDPEIDPYCLAYAFCHRPFPYEELVEMITAIKAEHTAG